MSRIDEALKRVSEGARGGMGCVDSTARTASKESFEDYPLEKTIVPPDRARKSDALPARPVAVPSRSSTTAIVAYSQYVSNEKLVVSPTCDRICVEQYRRVAASLHETQLGRGLKALVVSSAVPKEGKTLTAVNLALTFSESYQRRVLLIDADLHQPSIHEVLGIPNVVGLSEVLRSQRLDLPTTSISPHLTVMTAGTPDVNPLAGLSSPRMGELLAKAASDYDWVILDTPPLALLSDAQLLARLTQATLFVVGAGSTPFAVVNKAIEELGREHIIGTVLNGVADQAFPVAGQYGHYYETPIRGNRE